MNNLTKYSLLINISKHLHSHYTISFNQPPFYNTVFILNERNRKYLSIPLFNFKQINNTSILKVMEALNYEENTN